MDIVIYFLSGLVLISLIATLLFVTKAVKARNNPKEKNQNLTKAGIAVCVYMALNIARMYLEGNPF